MKNNLLIALLLMCLFAALGMTNVYAYWGSVDSSITHTEAVVTIGEWSPILPFDRETDYEVGDTFTYDGSIWRIRGSWFDPDKFLKSDGTINFNYVRSYGPIEEVTDEWRSYNTYEIGDVVTHNGYSWVVLHGGASASEPGLLGTAWNRLGIEWFMYNTYYEGDVVEYDNQQWIALQENWNRQPGTTFWAWQLI